MVHYISVVSQIEMVLKLQAENDKRNDDVVIVIIIVGLDGERCLY